MMKSLEMLITFMWLLTKKREQYFLKDSLNEIHRTMNLLAHMVHFTVFYWTLVQ